MTPQYVLALGKEAIWLTLTVSAPMLILGLLVGVIISIFQAVTQIHEMTLTFVPKILSIFIGLLLLLPWIMHQLTGFTIEIINSLPNYTR